MIETKLFALILLGPLAAAYDFVTNPAAPPQIFAAQYEESFGRPPGANLPARPQPNPRTAIRGRKRVYLTHG